MKKPTYVYIVISYMMTNMRMAKVEMLVFNSKTKAFDWIDANRDRGWRYDVQRKPLL